MLDLVGICNDIVVMMANEQPVKNARREQAVGVCLIPHPVFAGRQHHAMYCLPPDRQCRLIQMTVLTPIEGVNFAAAGIPGNLTCFFLRRKEHRRIGSAVQKKRDRARENGELQWNDNPVGGDHGVIFACPGNWQALTVK